MTELTDDDSHPSSDPQIETWFGHLRYLIAMALIGIGGIATVVWTVFLGWLAGKFIYLW
jgi:hypothetical protein